MAGEFIGRKEQPAKSPPPRTQAGRKSRSEQDGQKKRRKDFAGTGKKTEPEEDNKIKPADLPHFQITAVKLFKAAGAAFDTVTPKDYQGFSFHAGYAT